MLRVGNITRPGTITPRHTTLKCKQADGPPYHVRLSIVMLPPNERKWIFLSISRRNLIGDWAHYKPKSTPIPEIIFADHKKALESLNKVGEYPSYAQRGLEFLSAINVCKSVCEGVGIMLAQIS